MTAAFDRLARPVQKWIRAQGWQALRDIQVRATHAILDGPGDVILAAATAGGKTEAAFLPLISQVLDDRDGAGPGFDLLYIGPLKALITDQAGRLAEICRDAGLPVVPWHGDVAQSVKRRALARPSGIVMITPESLEALFIRRGTEMRRLFAPLRAVVIDEMHSLLDSPRGVQLASLLTRLERTLGRPVRRIGLSATLGDMALARAYLRPDAAAAVTLVEDRGGAAELHLQLRGHLDDPDAAGGSAMEAVAAHLFKHLRGSDNLVFAGARQNVELYADRLRALCESGGLPPAFFAHHANLSRDHRDAVERALKDPRRPTTAVCTSTLELGIDIGDVTCVAQIGAPFSVAALRQRLGRSGRRPGQPAVLRCYVVEPALTQHTHAAERLRPGLMRAIAMIELLLAGWCEPPKPRALQLSTLVHQILAVIAERGGAPARGLYRLLCRDGPFRAVTPAQFAAVLRAIARPEAALIEQAGDGLLLLGRSGERLVAHHSFYAVFATPEEMRLICAGQELGSLPVSALLAPGMMLIFSGRRWLVEAVHPEDKTVLVRPAKGGTPPRFGGDPGEIHDRVIAEMFALWEGEACPVYLDPTAARMLEGARAEFARLGMDRRDRVQTGAESALLATRVGTVKTSALALALRAMGLEVETHDGLLSVTRPRDGPVLTEALRHLSGQATPELFAGTGPLMVEKFHPYLTPELLQADALSARLDAGAVAGLAARLLA